MCIRDRPDTATFPVKVPVVPDTAPRDVTVFAVRVVTIPVVAVRVVTIPVTIFVAPVLSILNLSVPLFV